MLSDAEVLTEARLLDAAELGRQQLRQTTSVHPAMTIDDAYRVQAAWRAINEARGERVVGHKIGLTSMAMQRVMNISTPDSGFLTDRMVIAPGAELSAATFLDPMLEMELAFVLGDDLAGIDVTVDDVLDATDHVVGAVELIAARTYRRDPDTGRTRTIVDTIADNAADAGVVSGRTLVAPRGVDLRWVSGVARRNGVVEESGVAAAVLEHPANGVAWLARRYAEQGLALAAGDLVLAGSFTRPLTVAAGDSFHFEWRFADSIHDSFPLHFA